jgi:flagellar basal body L-ring protein FlgH
VIVEHQRDQVEAAGADILNTGIGWHEARVPTIAYVVPRAAFRFAAGRIQRAETLNLRVAAIITQVLPNGNFVLSGTQEVRVNFEARVLQLAGVIRPQDITSVNTIRQDQLAEARIAYGGKGQITDFQQPRWGQQLFDIVSPF